jgi:hypothetical protein
MSGERRDDTCANLPVGGCDGFSGATGGRPAGLKDFAPPKRYTLLLCLMHRMRVRRRDQLALMFIKHMQKIQQRGKNELEELWLQHREKTARLVSLLAEVVTASDSSSSDEQIGSSSRHLLVERRPAAQLPEECEIVVAYNGDHYQPLLCSKCRWLAHTLTACSCGARRRRRASPRCSRG